MKTIKRIAAALAILATSTTFAAGHEYEVVFYKEAPVKVSVAPSGAETQQDSLNFGSKDAEPKGSVRLRETDTSLIVELDWWQGLLEELTDGKGSHLSLPAGVCQTSVTMPVQSDKPVIISCWDGKYPYITFDALTIRRLD